MPGTLPRWHSPDHDYDPEDEDEVLGLGLGLALDRGTRFWT